MDYTYDSQFHFILIWKLRDVISKNITISCCFHVMDTGISAQERPIIDSSKWVGKLLINQYLKFQRLLD